MIIITTITCSGCFYLQASTLLIKRLHCSLTIYSFYTVYKMHFSVKMYGQVTRTLQFNHCVWRNFKVYHSHQNQINHKKCIFCFCCNFSFVISSFFHFFIVNNLYFIVKQSLQLIFKIRAKCLHFFYHEYIHLIPDDFPL